jgi:hypothetical protein
VPLADGDPDLVLDVQSVFNQVYDEGAFARQIEYQRDPPGPPLARVDVEWLDALLRERGLRP